MPIDPIPGATYRLQLHGGFGFRDARDVLPYVRELGVTHLYLSPITTARSGSRHGYDVVDPTRLNPELGTREEFDALCSEAHERSLGILLDIVPNHMAASPENSWWWDVLRHGRGSEWFRLFDVDLDAPWPSSDRLLVPVLGDHYADVLERGELTVAGHELHYFEHRFPLAGTPREIEDASVDLDALDSLLSRQAYRLAHWRLAATEMNYRRFFDIDQLVRVRVEDPVVREITHALILELARDGLIDGVRIDHIDGMRDPKAYLRWLDAAWREAARREPWLLVEKILSGEETLRDDWPVDGTTGYEMLNVINGLFVDARGLRGLDAVYSQVTGRNESFEEVIYEKQTMVARDLFASEFARLAHRLVEVARRDRRGVDVPREQLHRALVQVSACLPVYRTYVNGVCGATDRQLIRAAIRCAREHEETVGGPDLDGRAYEVVEAILTMDVSDDLVEEAMDVIASWQQVTGPVMAKGLEDTSLYVYNRLTSLNDVGGEPGAPDVSVDRFHAFCQDRLRNFPLGLNASSTHDSKRGEDVRARLNVVSELFDEWADGLLRWRGLNPADGIDPNEEMLVYQTLVGFWPRDVPLRGPSPGRAAVVERLCNYLVKAAREAKEFTSWRNPYPEHERALCEFATRVVGNEEFLADLEPLYEKVSFHGAINSLSQLMLKVSAPGVPDFYQGSELWTLTLVDPDNRGAVDFDLRRRLLEEPGDPWHVGAVKLRCTRAALVFRQERRELFAQGDHVPLLVSNPVRRHVCAFARRLGSEWAIVTVPRRTTRLMTAQEMPVGSKMWGESLIELPEGAPERWFNVLTGQSIEGRLELAKVLEELPVALLRSEL